MISYLLLNIVLCPYVIQKQTYPIKKQGFNMFYRMQVINNECSLMTTVLQQFQKGFNTDYKEILNDLCTMQRKNAPFLSVEDAKVGKVISETDLIKSQISLKTAQNYDIYT